MSGEPYLAAEDSRLLRSALERLTGESCLEIGAGNGGNLIALRRRFGLVVGTDLVRPSMSDWRGEGADFVLADGASCIRQHSFDLVAFNPPYLGGRIAKDRAVEGGEDLEVPKAFLREALRTVKSTGKVVFLLNDEANLGEFQGMCAEKMFSLSRVAARRGFFEELAVYSAEAERQDLAPGPVSSDWAPGAPAEGVRGTPLSC